jgi:hypothetical protein
LSLWQRWLAPRWCRQWLLTGGRVCAIGWPGCSAGARLTPVIERRLDATRDQLSAAAPGDLEKVRASLAGQWETRFSDLLADHPDAQPELVALVEDLRVIAPVTAADHAVAAGRDVNVTAEGGSVAAAVIHGNVAPPGPTVPGPARG